MHDERRSEDEPLATVTHARLRASQGDVRGARSLLRTRLGRNPDDGEARALLDALCAATDRERVRTGECSLAAPVAATGAELRGAFRDALGDATSCGDERATLRRWLVALEGGFRVRT